MAVFLHICSTRVGASGWPVWSQLVWTPAESTFYSFKRNTCSSADTAPTTGWNVTQSAIAWSTCLSLLLVLLNLDSSVVASFLSASFSPVCLLWLLTVDVLLFPCPLTVQQTNNIYLLAWGKWNIHWTSITCPIVQIYIS